MIPCCGGILKILLGVPREGEFGNGTFVFFCLFVARSVKFYSHHFFSQPACSAQDHSFDTPGEDVIFSMVVCLDSGYFDPTIDVQIGAVESRMDFSIGVEVSSPKPNSINSTLFFFSS